MAQIGHRLSSKLPVLAPALTVGDDVDALDWPPGEMLQ